MTDVKNHEISAASEVAASMSAGRMPTGNSPGDALLLSSDEESGISDFSDGESDTSFSPLGELCRGGTGDVGFGSIAPPDKWPYAISSSATAAISGDSDAKELLEGIKSSDGSALIHQQRKYGQQQFPVLPCTSVFSQSPSGPSGTPPMEQDQPIPTGITLYGAKLTSGDTRPCIAAEIPHALPSRVQTPHPPCPGHLATLPLPPDDSSQEHMRLNGAWSDGDSNDEAEGLFQRDNAENDNTADLCSPIDFSSIGEVPKLTRLLDETPKDAPGASSDIDIVSEEPFLTQGAIDKIASSRQQQPSSPQGSPAPFRIPTLRRSPTLQRPQTKQHQPNQDLLRRTGSLPYETGQEPIGNVKYYELGKVTSHASPPRVQFPTLPSSRSLSTPTRLEEITDPHDLVNEGNNGRQESPKVKRDLRPRIAALNKNRRSPSKSSIDSSDEGANISENTSDDDDYTGRPQRKRRKNPPGFETPNKRHRRSSSIGRASGPHSISTPPSSQIHSDEEDITGTLTAAFEEWPLQDAVLKRVTEGGQITFQLQFTSGRCASQGVYGCTSGNREDQPSTGTELSMKRGMFHTASSEAEGSIRDCNEEYAIEQIRDHKFTKPGNQGLQLHVKWRNTRKLTWEPVDLMEDTEAYDVYLKHNDISQPSKPRKRGRPRKHTCSHVAPAHTL